MRNVAAVVLCFLGLACLTGALGGFHAAVGNTVGWWLLWVAGVAFYFTGFSYAFSGKAIDNRVCHLFTAGLCLLGILCARWAVQDAAEPTKALVDWLWALALCASGGGFELVRRLVLQQRENPTF